MASSAHEQITTAPIAIVALKLFKFIELISMLDPIVILFVFAGNAFLKLYVCVMQFDFSEKIVSIKNGEQQ